MSNDELPKSCPQCSSRSFTRWANQYGNGVKCASCNVELKFKGKDRKAKTALPESSPSKATASDEEAVRTDDEWEPVLAAAPVDGALEELALVKKMAQLTLSDDRADAQMFKHLLKTMCVKVSDLEAAVASSEQRA